MASSVEQALALESVGHDEMLRFLSEMIDEYEDEDDFDCLTLGMFKALIETLIVRDIHPMDIIAVCYGMIHDTLNYDKENVH